MHIRLVAAVAALVIWPAAASACIRVGVYQDRPATSLPRLATAVGPGVTTVSVYVGANELVDPRVIALAKERHLLLVVAWQPDDRAATLDRVAFGSYDGALRRLARQLRGLEPKPILRPMPEPNTPWYAWSGEVSKQGAGRYVRAWRHVRHVVRQASQGRIRLMWTPYARSVPDEPGNRIRDYFPGRDHVDAVGAVAYNFGTTDVLDWTAPQALFARAYATIDRLARKPFWIAETGSTGLGGSKQAWIGQLGADPARDAAAARRALVRRPRAERRLPHHADARHDGGVRGLSRRRLQALTPPTRPNRVGTDQTTRRTVPRWPIRARHPSGHGGPPARLAGTLQRAFVRLPCAGSDPRFALSGV